MPALCFTGSAKTAVNRPPACTAFPVCLPCPSTFTWGTTMKQALTAVLLLALAASPAFAADTGTVAPTDTAITLDHAPHPFNVRDLVMMDRVSDPQLSPDGRYAAYSLRST